MPVRPCRDDREDWPRRDLEHGALEVRWDLIGTDAEHGEAQHQPEDCYSTEEEPEHEVAQEPEPATPKEPPEDDSRQPPEQRESTEPQCRRHTTMLPPDLILPDSQTATSPMTSVGWIVV